VNRAEIRDEIRQRVGEDLENFWRNSYINRSIDQACQRFTHEERWKWLTMRVYLSLPAGEYEIQLVDDVDYTRQFDLSLRPTIDTTDIRLLTPRKVDAARLQELRQENPTVVQARPHSYCLDRRVRNNYTLPDPNSDTTRSTAIELRVFPTPNIDYDVDFRCYRNVRLLADDTAVPDLPIQYHDGIVALATGNIWLRELNGGTKAQEQFNVYNTILEQARRDNAANADDEMQVFGIDRVRNRWESEGDWLRMQVAEPLGP
jgi:hypothetical protein